MELSIWVSDKLRPGPQWGKFKEFVQQQANRLGYGYPQYEAPNGGPHKIQKYFSRLQKEAKAYKRSGNAEHLRNIANYAWLESMAPENPRFHWDDSIDSVTRKRRLSDSANGGV